MSSFKASTDFLEQRQVRTGSTRRKRGRERERQCVNAHVWGQLGLHGLQREVEELNNTFADYAEMCHLVSAQAQMMATKILAFYEYIKVWLPAAAKGLMALLISV